MNKYEAMFILKPDLSEEEKNNLFNQLSDSVTKNSGNVTSGSVWSEKRKMHFPIKKHQEAVYYLLNFTLPPQAVKDLRTIHRLNENILRVLISKLD